MTLLNLRDVASSSGTRPLVPGRLFRSGQPFGLTEADIAPIEGEVDTIIDLRDLSEVKEGEWRLMQAHGARVVHVPLAGQVMTMAPSEEVTLGGFYVAMLDTAAPAFAQLAREVAASDGVLLHCAAGKDRTGVATAMMLDLLGVGEDAIAADYERTGEAMPKIIAQLAEIYGFARGAATPETPATPESPETPETPATPATPETPASAGPGAHAPGIDLNGIPREFLQVPRSAIDQFMAALTQAGGARGYLTAAGLGAGELDQLAVLLTTSR